MAGPGRSVAWAYDVVLKPGETFDASVAIRSTVAATYGTSVFVQGPDRYERRILQDIGITASLPDQFYGVQRIDGVSVVLSNVDGLLTSLLHEELRGQPVRLRRYDGDTGELTDKFHGVVNGIVVGDTEATLQLEPYNLGFLDEVLPRRLVTTSEFPTATDAGLPISLVFGTAADVPCRYVANDDVAQHYDYLIGTGELDVHAVKKNGQPTYTSLVTLVAVTTGQRGAGIYTVLTITDDEHDAAAGTYTGFFIRKVPAFTLEDPSPFLDPNKPGNEFGRQTDAYRIVAHPDATTLYIDGDPGWSPTKPQKLEIQEFQVLETTYVDGTALRFGRAQIDSSGALMSITADVTRRRNASRNILLASSNLSIFPWQLSPGSMRTLDTLQENPDGTVPARTYSRIHVGYTEYVITQAVPAASWRPTGSDVVTFSIWAMHHDTTAIIVVTIAQVTTTAFSVRHQFTMRVNPSSSTTDQWTRYTFVCPGNWTTGRLAVRLSGTPSADDTYLWGAQLELGGTATAYEETLPSRDFNTTLHWPPTTAALEAAHSGVWTFPVAIQEILTHPRWGFGQRMDTGSVRVTEQAIWDSTGLVCPSVGTTRTSKFLYANGSLPDPFGQTPSLQDVINDLTQAHGMVLSRSGSSWRLTPDIPTTTPTAIFGTEDTPYDNMRASGGLSQPSLDESTRHLTLFYAPKLGRFNDSLEAYYSEGIRATVSTLGQAREQQLRLVGTRKTAEAVQSYLAAYAPRLTRPFSWSAGSAAATVAIGDVVSAYAPKLHFENRLLHSEDLTTTSWVTIGTLGMTTRVDNAIGDPEHRTHGATRWTVGTGGAGTSGTLLQRMFMSAGAPVSGRYYGSCWLRTEADEAADPQGTTALVWQVNGVDAVTVALSPAVSTSWRRYQAVLAITPSFTGTVGFGIRAYGPRATARVFFGWGALVATDFDSAYVRTTTAAKPRQVLFRVFRHAETGKGEYELTGVPYDAVAIFAPPALTVDVFQPRNPDVSETNPELLPPGKATGIAVPPDTAIYVQGATASADIEWLMPTTNAAGVVVQIKEGRPESNDRWRDVATVTTTEVSLGSRARATATGLQLDTWYTVRVLSYSRYARYNGFGDAPAYFSTPAA